MERRTLAVRRACGARSMLEASSPKGIAREILRFACLAGGLRMTKIHCLILNEEAQRVGGPMHMSFGGDKPTQS